MSCDLSCDYLVINLEVVEPVKQDEATPINDFHIEASFDGIDMSFNDGTRRLVDSHVTGY